MSAIEPKQTCRKCGLIQEIYLRNNQWIMECERCIEEEMKDDKR